ncbi:CAP domain-containing protein [Ursidibacter sp. B-7004-1]
MKKVILSISLLFCTTSVSFAETLEEMLEKVNQARSQARHCGKKHFSAAKPLQLNIALQKAAEKHAVDMAQKKYFAHNSLDGRTPFDRIKKEGYEYSTAGENIAMGNKTSTDALQSWLNSPGHCSNIMNPKFTQMGMARSGIYWVQTFGTPW